jgi:hypothetical protein
LEVTVSVCEFGEDTIQLIASSYCENQRRGALEKYVSGSS